MNYVLLILGMAAIVFLVYKWLQFRKEVAKTEGATKRKGMTLLFLGFMSFIGLGSFVGDVVLEYVGISKPPFYDWAALAAFLIFAIAVVLILRGNNKQDGKEQVTQNHSGTGDNVQGIKNEVSGISVSNSPITAGGNVEIGTTKNITQHQEKKKVQKKLTDQFPNRGQSDIIGRETDLAKLRDLLATQQKVVVVNGMGGIGKSTLAEVYVSKHYEDYEHIAWITQSSEDIAFDFANAKGLIANLEISIEGLKPDEIFALVLRSLKNLGDGPNLMVIDNAESNIEQYSSLLPGKPEWHLLLTSREEIEGYHEMPLDQLDPFEALALFKLHCKTIQDSAKITDLLVTVEYHTLTIEILAKTADFQNLSIEQLATTLQDDARSGTKVAHSQGGKIERVMGYLRKVFDMQKMTDNEVWIMKQFRCLPSEELDFGLLKDLINPVKTGRDEQFAEILNSLARKGWIQRNKLKNTYRVYRIISEVISKETSLNLSDVRELVGSIDKKLSIDEQKDNPVDKFVWKPFGEVILMQLGGLECSQIVSLQDNLAIVLKHLGDYQGAKNLLEKAMHSAEKIFGQGHPKTTSSYSNLGLVLGDLGDFQGAKGLLEKAMYTAEKNFGPEHSTTATNYSNLALALKGLGDFQEARSLLEKAVEYDEKNFGPEHPQTAVRYSNLALVLHDLGDFQEAKSLLEKAVASDEKNFGLEHPKSAGRYSNLATVLYSLKEYQKAKALLEKAIASDEKNFGKTHPYTTRSYSNMAMIMKGLGEFQNAKVILEKVKRLEEKSFGLEHPHTARSYSNLAFVLKDLGDFKGAKELLEKAIAIYENCFGKEHPRTTACYFSLALLLKAFEDLKGAKELLEKAMHSAEKYLGPDHPTTAIRYSNLANVLQSLEDYLGAKELLEKAIHSAEKNLGHDHPTTAIRYSNLANVLQSLEDYQGAKDLLEKAIHSAEKNFGHDHPTTAIRYSKLATVLQDLGN